jgi:predicted phosphoribosyltransferase
MGGRMLSHRSTAQEAAMFLDRQDAGRRLARVLAERHLVNPVVLALPRGGIPVAIEVAHALHAPMDLLFVRKIGAPGEPELAIAAVAEGAFTEPTFAPRDPSRRAPPPRAFELEVREDTGLSMQQDVLDQLKEIDRRRDLYLHGRPRVPVCGRCVVVVDDGIATGTTLRAALRSLRARGPARIVVAVPVAPPEEVERLRHEVDEVVCLETPVPFGAVGRFYAHFEQLDDEDVIDLLEGVH